MFDQSPDEFAFKSMLEDKINPDEPGFHWRSHGRGAIIYYVENSGIVPIYCEMPGVDYLDVLVFGETEPLDKKYYLDAKKVEILPLEERHRIQGLLVQWLSVKGARHDIKVGK